MRTVRVQFAWYMPVLATYEVAVPDDATPDQMIAAAQAVAEDDVWNAQTDCWDGAGATFVERIECDGTGAEIDVPEAWREETVMRTQA